MNQLKNALRTLVVPCVGLALMAGTAAAGDVYVVHGINGTDLGLDEALPVDIEVNGVCAFDDVAFGAATGANVFDTGTSSVTIRLSDGVIGSCTGTVVVDTTVNVAAFESAVLVAHLDPNGTITVSKFTANTAPLEDGQTRFSVAHAAAADRVDIQVRGTSGTKGRARLRQIANGEQSFAVDSSAGTYNVRVKPTFGKGVVADLKGVEFTGNVVVVAVGSVANETFSVIAVPITPPV